MSSQDPGIPPYTVVFGPNGNCTLEICPLEYSVYGYRPSLGANIAFLGLFAVAGIIHGYLGFRWKTWFFATGMELGCISAIIGYAGRAMMFYNPFNFNAFMLQIICVSSAPVYYSAAIYFTLAAAVQTLSPSASRLSPRLIYLIFLPCDLVSLAFQAVGGALSTLSSGTSQIGVNLALVGLSFQVFTMTIFVCFFIDYLIRYFRSTEAALLSPRQKIFFAFLVAAVLLILTRCAFRLAELHQGYTGRILKDEGLFIGFEGIMIIVAVYCLMIGHPGLAFKQVVKRPDEAPIDLYPVYKGLS